MAEGIKTDNWLSNWMIDRVYDTVQEDAQGNLNAGGLMGWAAGQLGYDVQSIEDQKGIDVGNRDAKSTMRQLGETYDSLGFDKGQNLTGEAVIAKKRELEEAKKKEEQERIRTNKVKDAATAQTNALEIVSKQNENSNNQFNATLKAQNSRHAFDASESSKKYAHEKSERRLDRRQQSELADSKEGLQMQMAIMQNDLAEKRMDYDRETQRMDKRSQAIAQLMSGIGALGGAFAL